jgi:hypothetical protein
MKSAINWKRVFFTKVLESDESSDIKIAIVNQIRTENFESKRFISISSWK